jgi:hypothetical protein
MGHSKHSEEEYQQKEKMDHSKIDKSVKNHYKMDHSHYGIIPMGMARPS